MPSSTFGESLPMVLHPSSTPWWVSTALMTAALDLVKVQRWGNAGAWSTGPTKGLRAEAKDAVTLHCRLKDVPAEILAPG